MGLVGTEVSRPRSALENRVSAGIEGMLFGNVTRSKKDRPRYLLDSFRYRRWLGGYKWPWFVTLKVTSGKPSKQRAEERCDIRIYIDLLDSTSDLPHLRKFPRWSKVLAVKAGMAQAHRTGKTYWETSSAEFLQTDVDQMKQLRSKEMSAENLQKNFETSQWMVARITAPKAATVVSQSEIKNEFRVKRGGPNLDVGTRCSLSPAPLSLAC